MKFVSQTIRISLFTLTFALLLVSYQPVHLYAQDSQHIGDAVLDNMQVQTTSVESTFVTAIDEMATDEQTANRSAASPIAVISVINNADNYFYFLKIDRNDSRVRMQVGLANNDRGGYELLDGIKQRFTDKGYLEWALVNGDYFGNGCPANVNCAQGLTYIDSMLRPNWSGYADTTKRGNIGFDSGVQIAIGSNQSRRNMVISGGPWVVQNGNSAICSTQLKTRPNGQQYTLFSTGEEFNGDQSSYCGDKKGGTFVGYSQDGRYLFMGVTKGYTMVEVGNWLRGQGAYDVLKFDSGGSSALYYNGERKDKSYDGRPIPNYLAVVVNPCPIITAWKGEYWNNRDLSGTPVRCRNDGAVDFDWGSGGPGSGVNNDNFSARWTRTVNFSAGRYRFRLSGDDGLRLWVNNNLLINQWKDQGRTEYTADIDLAAGNHNLKVEYYENGGGANVTLRWETLSTGSGNLARGRPSYATSRESSALSPAQGNDGNTGTRWSSNGSGANGEWWWVDLGSVQTFDRVVVRWEAAYAANHFIGWSNDGRNFTGYYYTIGAPGSYQYAIGTRTARYVGIWMYRRAPCCGNYSFYELEVYRGAVAVASAEATETTIEEETLFAAIADGEETTVTLDHPEAGQNSLFLPLIAK
jgi:exopolysaccharide biosynthesis protein